MSFTLIPCVSGALVALLIAAVVLTVYLFHFSTGRKNVLFFIIINWLQLLAEISLSSNNLISYLSVLQFQFFSPTNKTCVFPGISWCWTSVLIVLREGTVVEIWVLALLAPILFQILLLAVAGCSALYYRSRAARTLLALVMFSRSDSCTR